MTAAKDRDRVLVSVDEFVEACTLFRKTLRSVAASNRRVRVLVEEGKPVREVLSAIPTSAIRKTMTQQIEELEAARHNVRLAVFALGLKGKFKPSAAFPLARTAATRLGNGK